VTTALSKRDKPVRPRKSTPHAAVDFINCLCHTGDFWGVPFCLRPWQEDIIRKIFDASGKSKYRKVFIALPRKQGKTELAAAILLYLMFGTGKRAQRIFSASGTRDQAALIYGAAASMIRQSQALSDIAITYDGYKRIKCEPIDGVYQALSSEHAEKYGLRPSAVMLDELHVLPNRDLFNALMTAFGATVNPLTVMITTAGWDQTSLCYEQWKYAEQVLNGSYKDDSFLPIIYAAPPDADWTSEEVWRKAMPGLGDFCQLQFIQDECQRAQKIPAYENTFKQFYLNMWTEQAERWLSVESWKACGDFFPGAEMAGQSCYVGLDLGVTGDMSVAVMVFPTEQGVRVLAHGWVPKEGKWRDELRNKDRYLAWERDGYLTFTPGNTTDHSWVKRDLVGWNAKYPFYSVFADRAYATQLLNELFNEEGIPVKGIPQGAVTLNEACVLLEEMVVGGTIEHGSNPILDWNIANASLVRNTTGLIYPDRSSSTERIDGLSALINGLTAYKDDPEDRGPSYYNTNPIFTL
jgi:phage terminase large subunit-like protein